MRGHSESYDFGLELETVLAKAQVERSVNLPEAANRDKGRQYRISLRMGQLE